MTRLIGVDPGYNMTGIAVMMRGEFVFWAESNDPCAIWEIIFQNAADSRQRVKVILEDFLGSGPRNKWNQRTIEILGYIYFSCVGANIPCERVPQWKRKASVCKVPEYIRGKDEIAAAAHVLAYREGRLRDRTRMANKANGRVLRRASPTDAAG